MATQLQGTHVKFPKGFLKCSQQPWQQVFVLSIGCVSVSHHHAGLRGQSVAIQGTERFLGFRHSCRNSGQKTRSQSTCNGFSDTSQHTSHMKWPRRSPSLRPRPCTGAAILLPAAQRDAAEKREPKGRGLQGAGS